MDIIIALLFLLKKSFTIPKTNRISKNRFNKKDMKPISVALAL